MRAHPAASRFATRASRWRAGLTDAALAVGVEKMTHASNPRITESLNSAMDNRADAPSGLTFPGLFGMAYRLHAQRYGTTRDQVSSVVVKNKANGLSNPLAQMGARLTVDDVPGFEAHRRSAEALRLLPSQRWCSSGSSRRP